MIKPDNSIYFTVNKKDISVIQSPFVIKFQNFIQEICDQNMGQFNFDYPSLENKIVFGMGGYGGKVILIDVEDSRIVVVNSIHFNLKRFKYDYEKLLFNPIKYGKKNFQQ